MPTTSSPNLPATRYGIERTHVRILRRRLDYLNELATTRRRQGLPTILEDAEGDALDWAIALVEQVLSSEAERK